MTSDARSGARARVTAVRRTALDRLAALGAAFDDVVEASAWSNADDEHDPEGATVAFERAQLGALVRQARADLTDAEAALARLEAGTYETCERCGGPIGAERLEVRPTARRCITCAARPDRG